MLTQTNGSIFVIAALLMFSSPALANTSAKIDGASVSRAVSGSVLIAKHGDPDGRGGKEGGEGSKGGSAGDGHAGTGK